MVTDSMNDDGGATASRPLDDRWAAGRCRADGRCRRPGARANRPRVAEPSSGMMIRKTCAQWRRVGRELAPISRKVRCVGSLRNPVGPLPSSIYWRRRAVALSLIALLAVLVLWVVTSGGGSGNKGERHQQGPRSHAFDHAGPLGLGPRHQHRAGWPRRVERFGRLRRFRGLGRFGRLRWRSNSADGGASTGSGGAPAAPTPVLAAGVRAAAAAARGDAGVRVPAGSSVPTCAPGSLTLTLRSTKTSYEPGEKPRIEVVAQEQRVVRVQGGSRAEGGGGDGDVHRRTTGCGPRRTARRVTPGRSSRCRGPRRSRTPWSGTARTSAPGCATPAGGVVGPGTYLVEAHFPGLPVARASFALAKD